jgi:hypothetical protein
MKRLTSHLVVFTLLFSILSTGFPVFSGQAAAAAAVAQNHTFETTDPNFGSFQIGAEISPVPSMFGGEQTFSRKIVADDTGNRALEVTVPADKQGKTSFYYGPYAGEQATGNRFSFEASLSFSNQAKEFDLKVIPGDWGQNLPIAKFMPTGDIQVKSGTVSQTIWSTRGTWAANTTYVVKLDLYNDINKYDLFITNAATGQTTMLASGEPLMIHNGNGFLATGVRYYNIEAIGTVSASDTTIRYDNVKLSYSDDVRDAYIPASDATVLRTTTFETDDSDAAIAAAATGSIIKSNILDEKSPSVMKIVEENGSRWVEVATAQNGPGDIGFPIFPTWSNDSIYKSYTLEADFILKDNNADYYLRLIDGTWGVKSNTLLFSKDGNIYSRSSDTGNGAFAARTAWEVDKAFSLKLVVHADSLSYDLYHVKGGIATRLVNNEPIQNSQLIRANGLAAMMLHVEAGTHSQSTILVDNIKLSASNLEGTAPIINASPGVLLNSASVIGDPVEYYVSPTGNDANDGLSVNTPFKTIQKAADLTAPGDTVYLMDGTFSYSGGNRMLSITKSGALNSKTNEPAYITYKAYPGDKPILTTDNAWDVIQIIASYIVIDGLTIKGNNASLTVKDGEDAYNYYMNSIANGTPVDYSNPVFTKTNTNGISVEGRNRVQAGLDPLSHIIIKNNEVYNMPGGGISAIESDYITIENNKVYNNAWYMIWAGSGISVFHSMDSDTNTTTYKNIVRNNIVHDNETKVKWIDVKRYSDGNGIIIDDNKNEQINWVAYKGKTLVINNVSYNNGGSGIHAFNSANIDIVNNTLYNNNQSPHLAYAQLFASSSEKVNLFNNIVYSRDLRPGETKYDMNNATGSDLVIYANNIYYNGGTPLEVGINDVIADPKFVSLDPMSEDFLRLQSDSPAIDRGTRTLAPAIDLEGASRPQGEKYDIGAYESSYTSGNPIVDDVIDIEKIRQSMIFIPENGEAHYGTPSIDGEIDDVWSTTPVINVSKYLTDPLSPVTSGATSNVRVLWDEDHLYVLAEVTDPVLGKASANVWEQDSVEIFLDENNEKTTSHQADDRQYRINYDNEKSVGSKGNTDEFISETKLTLNGYVVEVKIPLKTIKGADGTVIGFDAQVNDDKGQGFRESTAIWSDTKGVGYSNTSRWGNVTLLSSPYVSITAVTAVNIATKAGVAPVLPSEVTVELDNATTSTASVVWDAINPEQYAQEGSFTVNGAVASTQIKAVANITVHALETEYAISLGAEQNGGLGKTRPITISGDSTANLEGKYLIVQMTEGTGVNAKVSVVMIAATNATTTVSYAKAGTKVDAWLASGMPDFAGPNLGVTLYAYASTSN